MHKKCTYPCVVSLLPRHTPQIPQKSFIREWNPITDDEKKWNPSDGRVYSGNGGASEYATGIKRQLESSFSSLPITCNLSVMNEFIPKYLTRG
jgi:hypothetical protein